MFEMQRASGWPGTPLRHATDRKSGEQKRHGADEYLRLTLSEGRVRVNIFLGVGQPLGGSRRLSIQTTTGSHVVRGGRPARGLRCTGVDPRTGVHRAPPEGAVAQVITVGGAAACGRMHPLLTARQVSGRVRPSHRSPVGRVCGLLRADYDSNLGAPGILHCRVRIWWGASCRTGAAYSERLLCALCRDLPASSVHRISVAAG